MSIQQRCLIILLPLLLWVAADMASAQVELTPAQRDYLEQLGSITVAPDPDWKPFTYLNDQGEFAGIAIDLLNLLEERLGITFTYVYSSDWDEAVALSRAGEVLILPFSNQTPAREEWLVFTEPLLVDPNVFITREEHPFISDASQLTDKTIVFPAGTAMEERVRRIFPNLTILNVESEDEVFQAVDRREADMTLRSLTMAAYTIRREGLFNLKIAGQAPDEFVNRLRMCILKEEEMLRDILDLGIATISPMEREEIVNRHVNITVVTPMDYGFILRIAGVLALLILVSFYWNLQLKRNKRKLEESERSKSVLIRNLPGMAYRCRLDENWTMEFISEGCTTLTGYTPEELLGNRKLSFNDLIAPEYRQSLWDQWQKYEPGGKPNQLEYEIITASGERKWVWEQGVPVKDADGNTVALEGLILDLSDRKKFEDQLKQSEKRYIEIANQVPGVVYQFYARPNGELGLYYVNERSEQIFGLKHDLPDYFTHFTQIVIPEHRDDFINSIMESVRDFALWKFEGLIEKPSGERRWISASALPSRRDEEIIYNGIVVDITERKKAEEKNQMYSRLQQLLAEISSNFIQATQGNMDQLIDEMLQQCGLFLNVDRMFLFKFSGDEKYMSNTHEWCAEGIEQVNTTVQNYPVSEVPLIAEIIERRAPLLIEDVETLPDGPEKEELRRQEVKSVVCLPVVVKDQLMGYFGFDSVREKRTLDDEQIQMLQVMGNILGDALMKNRYEVELLDAMEKAESATRSKSIFLANMSHEIRTPLNGVIGFTELLKTTPLSAVQKQYVDNANVSGHTLLGIINDILDFSKIEAEMMQLERVPCDLHELIENSADLVTFAASRKNLELLLRIDPNLPQTIMTDPVRLKQILTNLMGNAVKFTDSGEVELSVSHQALDEGKSRLSFRVRDTGIGIPEKQQKKLFAAFSQADSSTTRKYGGSGLGLMISQRIANAMESQIRFESREGEGSEFFFEIIAETEQQPAPQEVPGHLKRCLIIDDHSGNREILQLMLDSLGISCETSADGESALRLLRESEPFDLILCDYRMPEMDGLETVQKMLDQKLIQQEKPAVIMMHSPSDEETFYERCEEMSLTDMITKPVKRRELISTLRELTNRSETENRAKKVDREVAASHAEAYKNLKILVAEDIGINMILVRALLRQLCPGAELLEVANGVEAVKLYQEHSPDLILMDIQMPEMDGLDATKKIRQIESESGTHVPIIACTAGALSDEKEKCLAAGMDDFLAKPVERVKMQAILEEFLEASSRSAVSI